MLSASSTGSFKNTLSFLEKMKKGDLFRDLDRYGKMGVDALAKATPKDTGETSGSWSYKVTRTPRSTSIAWYNDETNDGANVVILLQYGHATGTGGYVAGQDFINPAIKPIFDKIAEDVWKKVTNG